MTSETPSSAGMETASERVSRETYHQRRRRVWRRILLVVVLLLAMVMLSFLTREQQELAAARERMEYARQELQRLYDQRGVSPRKIPPPELRDALEGQFGERVRYNEMFEVYVQASQRVVGVLCSRHPHQRLFLPSGRFVVTFDTQTKKYELNWMSEGEFVRRAKELGLQISVQP